MSVDRPGVVRPPSAAPSGGGGAADATRRGVPARLTPVTWLRAFGEVVRSGLTIEDTRLEPLLALRTAAGVAIVIGPALWLVSPAYAASAALGAYSAGGATFQRTWRPRKVIALGAGAGLALSTFVGYLAAGRLVTFLPLLAVWAFVAGMAWAVGSTAGIVAATTVGSMLVTITLPTSVGRALEHAGIIALGGVAQAVLILLFPIRRWGAHRDALADALAAVADYARRLRHDPIAPFDPEPLMTARDAAAVTPSQARTRPPVLHGPRGLAERIRPVVAALADPDVGAPAEGPGRDRARELLDAAADVLDAAARSIRRGTPAEVPPGAPTSCASTRSTRCWRGRRGRLPSGSRNCSARRWRSPGAAARAGRRPRRPAPRVPSSWCARQCSGWSRSSSGRSAVSSAGTRPCSGTPSAWRRWPRSAI